MNLTTFRNEFGTDSKCLEYVRKLRFPHCTKCRGKLYPINRRVAYACQKGHQVYPLAGTIFEKSTTPLSSWFFAIYLMSQTRAGVSAKMLERILGVTYKTAWRMFKKIREIMDEDVRALQGEVEVDETWIGGKDWFNGKHWWSEFKPRPRELLVGLMERGGRVKMSKIANADPTTLTFQVSHHVLKGSRVITDGHVGYRFLPRFGYRHNFVNHSKHFVEKDNPSVHTQNIEGFWGQLKRGITGSYRHVSPKYLESYCNEYAFRFNHRKEDVFSALIERIGYEELPF